MNKAEELFQRIIKMRNGEEVVCSHCKKRSNGSYRRL